MACRDSFIAVAVAMSLLPLALSLPFIVLHGLNNYCEAEGMTWFTELLSNYSGQEGFCIEVGNGKRTSWLTSLTTQVDTVCETVKALPQLQDGYNIVGLSQGSMIGRGVIQWCDGAPLVNTLISIGGPHAGTASVPFCGSGFWCQVADALIKLGIYRSYVQNHVGPVGYVKIPTDVTAYLKGCKFLPRLNNELQDSVNTTYKERFASLNQLVLIMFENDNVLIPPETAWFGFYPPNNCKDILAANEVHTTYETDYGIK